MNRINPVTWAVLDVYAGTVEGQTVEHLNAFVREHAPRGRMKNTARITAEGLGCLDAQGRLTATGWQAARAAVARHLGSAGGQA
ncbi:hypothetical protein [Deinococcus fonticola]|uniref:hypothetical protein n=1 Tax=Deinococcus fonticola TaxID=2528713 RepID=UPI001075132C|nr:hypothetical protein [Deinococcus fonticola]